jgi:hypothetical protein
MTSKAAARGRTCLPAIRPNRANGPGAAGKPALAVPVEAPGGPAIRLVVVVPTAKSGVDRSGVSSDNPAMDPVIAALAQLVRDRYERELAAKAARRGRLRVMEGKSA